MKSKIMYVEYKTGLIGPAWIGRVEFSKSGKTLYYLGLALQSLKGFGVKANYFVSAWKDDRPELAIPVGQWSRFWVGGPRQDGEDRQSGGPLPVFIDEDVREEYWLAVRKRPESINKTVANL